MMLYIYFGDFYFYSFYLKLRLLRYIAGFPKQSCTGCPKSALCLKLLNEIWLNLFSVKFYTLLLKMF